MNNLGNKHLEQDQPVYMVQDVSLNTAIICDIDGTLAIMGDRSPFDGTKVHLDTVNRPVADLLDVEKKSSKHTTVILLSGRSEEFKEATVKWLEDNAIMYDELYMRLAKDYRKDSLVKWELFNNHVQGRYRIKYVLDDRDQVVAMWRKALSLPCFQVFYGDF